MSGMHVFALLQSSGNPYVPFQLKSVHASLAGAEAERDRIMTNDAQRGFATALDDFEIETHEIVP
jgi:hypothetical protein